VKHAGTTPTPTDVDIEGVVYSVKMADCVYCVSTNNHSEVTGALIDQGANGGIAGNDCQVIEVNDQPHQYVNVEVSTGTSWSGTGSSRLVQSPIPTVDP
jgi:hypothetical protein